ncbi:hypothetical protein SG34_000195 [Thalassomonas viridans]|uniref:Secreted protein n=1 Tax=Thalassomonas viridans TaxID=137584 RepID=A0AAE9Z533_9GAMM|nr:hypothetical protein [Thalassomonas viridans]WDE05408.1 hypothetical protein SG34_000195 [Thalassomonas viridans]
MKIINSIFMVVLTLILLPLTAQAYEQLPVVEDGYSAQLYCECLYLEKTQEEDSAHINRPICDDLYPIMQEPELAQVNAVLEPIYIGGVLYQLDKADFTPVYNERWLFPPCDGEPILIKTLAGYTVNIPVDGDYGQNLIFDINGRSDGKVMSLTTTCGSFTATDSGDKYIISKQMNTNGSCTNMELKFSFTSSTPPALIDLSVLIAEVF